MRPCGCGVVTVVDPGWVHRGSFRPNPGQFPIRVERHLNAFVGDHLPGVTTVTAATRYYALHGYVAHAVQQDGLDESAAIGLLRRSEALLAYVTRTHGNTGTHAGWVPSPHGIDAIMRTLPEDGGLDLVKAAKTYSETKWAFANPYRGSELTLKVLSTAGFVPGDWYDHTAAGAALAPLVEVARSMDHVSDDTVRQLAGVCLCTTPTSTDGAWLATLLSGDSDQPLDMPTMGGLLWQFGRMVIVATQVGTVSNADSLADLIMFDPAFRDHPKLQPMVAPLRWRGALLRKESVYALRLIWRDLNRRVEGARPVDQLIAAFADAMPDQTVGQLRAQLPERIDAQGHPLPAERQLDELPDLQRWLAILMLGADRLDDLDGQQLRGFRSSAEAAGAAGDELTPAWFAQQLEDFQHRSLREFGRHLATCLIRRSQRVALWKARYDPRTGVMTFPARLHVRDGIAVTVYQETAPVPATRIPQYLSIARQAGLFTQDERGALTAGPNGGGLA